MINPVIAFFRDSAKVWITLVQVVGVVAFVFVPMIVGYILRANLFSLQTQGLWNNATLDEGNFKFQHVMVEGPNPQDYWAILNADNSLSFHFLNGELITEAKIKELLSADGYHSSVEFPTENHEVHQNAW